LKQYGIKGVQSGSIRETKKGRINEEREEG